MAVQITTARELSMVLLHSLVCRFKQGAASLDSVRMAAMEAARHGAPADEIYRALLPLKYAGDPPVSLDAA